MLGRGRLASPGRNTDRGTDLKLQRRSWRYENASLAITLAGECSFCGQTTAPGYCTCRGPLCWRAGKAGESSYWPGKLLFAGVINQILLFTLAGESHFRRCSKHNLALTLAGEALLFPVHCCQVSPRFLSQYEKKFSKIRNKCIVILVFLYGLDR